MAAAINAATGFVVKKAYGPYHKDSIQLSDSMVALHWISSTTRRLKTFIRSLVIEVNRLTDVKKWRYIESSKMPADIGTRKGATLSDVNQDSPWINGLPLMVEDERDLPVQTIEEIKLNQLELAEAEKEKIVFKAFHTNNQQVPAFEASTFDKVKSRYDFSRYVIDPNRFSFSIVLRIFTLVLTFIKIVDKNIPKVQNMTLFHHKSPGDLPDALKCRLGKYTPIDTSSGNIVLTDEMLKASFYYFSLKATLEAKHFLGKGKYRNDTVEVDGVLYFSGRILPDQQFGGYPPSL